MRRVNRSEERKEELRKTAEEAAVKWQALNPAEQLKELDLRFGKDKGAGRQRARIATELAQKKTEKKIKKKAEKTLKVNG